VKDADEFADAVDAYERAQADALYVRGLWIGEGRPLIQQATNGLLGRHPLWRVMLEAEAHAARFRGELGLTPRSAKTVIRRGPGRPAGAASSPDRVLLRSVD
jgi:hypothetical protein